MSIKKKKRIENNKWKIIYLVRKSSRTRSPVFLSFLSCLDDSLSLVAALREWESSLSERSNLSRSLLDPSDADSKPCLRCLCLFSLRRSSRSWCLDLRSLSSRLSRLSPCLSRLLEDVDLRKRRAACGGLISNESAVSPASSSEKLLLILLFLQTVYQPKNIN